MRLLSISESLKNISFLLILFALMCVIPSVTATDRVHNIDTDQYFSAIQEAIDDSDTLDGHTIFVESGTYYENIIISKSLSIIGENQIDTIIDGGSSQNVIDVVADGVLINGFTIKNAYLHGVWLPDVKNCEIKNNYVLNNGWGIVLGGFNAMFNTVSGNRVIENQFGIATANGASNNSISGNEVLNNEYGIGLIDLVTYNTVSGNNIMNNEYGIELSDGADYNIVYGNNITDSETGVDFRWAGDHNSFHHNNFVDNTNQVFHFEGETSVWDDGYPSGGNYWSDYTGSDSDGDGIGDVPYVIDADNEDRYPLTSSFTRLYAVIESCDVNGETKDMFNTDENVYVRGSGFVPSVLYPRNPPIYVVEDTTWYNGMEIPERIPETVTTVFSGAFGDIETTLVWNSPLTPGKYDIVVDENSNGVFDQNIDALDDMDVEITAGFYVSRGTLIGFIFDIIIPLIAIVEFVIIVILVLILLKKHGLPPKPPNPKSKE